LSGQTGVEVNRKIFSTEDHWDVTEGHRVLAGRFLYFFGKSRYRFVLEDGLVDDKKIWVTLSGLPLMIDLEWPFHRSTSGADFWVLHGDIRLAGAEELHAPVAVNLSATVREVLPSLEPGDAEAPVINALRKEVDSRQLEFLKSGKLKPVAFSSRHYDFKREKWVFGKATDDVIATFIERKVYWTTKLTGEKRAWIGDPADAQYLETTPGHIVDYAGVLMQQGRVQLDGDWAEASSGLMGRAEEFEAIMRAAAEELEKKHAFERG
jgi:hypothetical protein